MSSDNPPKGLIERLSSWFGNKLGVDREPVYDIDAAQEEALRLSRSYPNYESVYRAGAMSLNHIPLESEIEATAHLDPRQAEIMKASRELALSKDMTEHGRILSDWREKLEKRTVARNRENER